MFYITARLSYRVGDIIGKLTCDEEYALDDALDESWDVAKEAGELFAEQYLLRFASLKFLGSILRKLGAIKIMQIWQVAMTNGRLAEIYIANKYLLIRNIVKIGEFTPDFLNGTVIREIKNVIRLSWSGRTGRQLEAFAREALRTNRHFYIHVRPGTIVDAAVESRLITIFGRGNKGVRWDIIRDVPESLRVI